MIRAALASLGFLICVLLLVLLQPGRSDYADQPEPDAFVTRSETAFQATEIQAYETLSASLSQLSETVEAQTPDLVSLPAPVAEATPLTPEPELASLTEPEAVLPAAPAAAPLPPRADLEGMIITALSQGQSEAYIDALVNSAARNGLVEVPETLVKEDGRIDTASLLSALQVSGLQAGIDEAYTVRPGDSLKAISYRFYGTTEYAMDIFNANRDRLASHSDLVPSTEIIIPAR